MEYIQVNTSQRNEFVDITQVIIRKIKSLKVVSGICVVYSPHTTTGITINENADPSVVQDLLMQSAKIAPYRNNYLHREGNSDAHVKATLYGSSVTLIIEEGMVVLGTWQGIYFCEFDGPRQRKVYLKIIRDT